MRLSHFNSTQQAIRDMFITGIKARIDSSIASDSKLPVCHTNDIYVLLTLLDGHLFFYNGSEANKVAAIKLVREFANKFSETLSFTIYDEKLATAMSDNILPSWLEKQEHGWVFNKFVNKMTLKEAKDIVDSYYQAICKYADDTNKLSES